MTFCYQDQRKEAHHKIWDDLRNPKLGNIQIEDPTDLSRFLGCNHHHTSIAATYVAGIEHQTIAFEMAEYIDQAMEKYEAIVGSSTQQGLNPLSPRWLLARVRGTSSW